VIRSFNGAVEYEAIYDREDGSERIGSPQRVSTEAFIKHTFEGWYTGPWPPPARLPSGSLDPLLIGDQPTY
jgi:hypothetical protein